MKNLILRIPEEDFPKAKAVLKQNGIRIMVDTSADPEPFGANKPTIRRGKRKAGERPSDFGGIWAKDERTLDSIRQKAWPKRE